MACAPAYRPSPSPRGATALSAEGLSVWADAQPPRLGAHQFSLAGLQLLVRFEVLYTLQRRDETRPPLDAMQVRIVAGRLAGTASVRHVDLEALWSCGGLQYNATAKGLAHDVGRHIGRAWCSYTGQDPCAGDVWDLGLLDCCRRTGHGATRSPLAWSISVPSGWDG